MSVVASRGLVMARSTWQCHGDLGGVRFFETGGGGVFSN
jgi:hypothetical protein